MKRDTKPEPSPQQAPKKPVTLEIKATPAEKKPPKEEVKTPSVEEKKPQAPKKKEKEDVSEEEIQKELKKIALEEGKTVEQLLEDDDEEEEESPSTTNQIDEDPREHISVVFIGHVDAGKSTLSGQILYLSGMVDQRTLEKYEREAKEQNRESWFYAYIMDINEDERAKGKTVEVGRASFETPNKRYTILDAPGHKNYVPNMIGGCAQADVAILVISARRGEFEAGFNKGGQTREHTMLAKTLGVKKIIVVINKMDEPTVNWSKERYDSIVQQLTEFLKSSGYNPKRDVSFIPVSGQKGSNIKESFPQGTCDWYKGKTLFQLLDELEPAERFVDAPLRIPVVDRMREAGKTWVFGKVESGIMEIGRKVMVMPNKQTFEVTDIVTETSSLKRAKTGENIRFSLKGAEEESVRSGFVVCDPKKPVPCQTKFEAQLVILELPPLKPVFTAGYNAIIHIHTAVEECTVTVLLDELDKKTAPPHKVLKKKPKFVKAGSLVRCILQCAQPVCLENFVDNPQLGRFTLRDETKTIAFGKVTALGPRKKTTN